MSDCGFVHFGIIDKPDGIVVVMTGVGTLVEFESFTSSIVVAVGLDAMS